MADSRAQRTDKIRTLTKPARREGILHSEHDVTRLQGECQHIVDTLARMGVGVQMEQLESRVAWVAILRLLVAKGICTDAEAEGERFTVMKGMLGEILHSVEEQQLQQGKPQIQRVERPKLAVATH